MEVAVLSLYWISCTSVTQYIRTVQVKILFVVGQLMYGIYFHKELCSSTIDIPGGQ